MLPSLCDEVFSDCAVAAAIEIIIDMSQHEYSCVPFLMRYNAIDLYTSTVALVAVVTVSYSVRAALPQSLLPSAISNFLGPATALKASSSVYNRK